MRAAVALFYWKNDDVFHLAFKPIHSTQETMHLKNNYTTTQPFSLSALFLIPIYSVTKSDNQLKKLYNKLIVWI